MKCARFPSLCRPGCVMRRGGVFLCCFGLRRGMFLQLLILLPPATYLWGSNLILSPTGNFLSIAKESHPAETRSLRKTPLLTKSMPPELKACRASWKMRPLPVLHAAGAQISVISSFIGEQKAVSAKRQLPVPAGDHGCSAGLGTVLLPCCYRCFVYSVL